MKLRSALKQRAVCRALAAIFPAAGIGAWAPPALADCTASGSIVTCSGTVASGFVASDTGLTVNVLDGTTLQANTAANPSVAAQINAASSLNNSGTIQNVGGSQTNNYGVSLNGSDTVFTNNGSVSVTLEAGDISAATAKNTRSIFGAISTATSEPFSNVQIINNGSITAQHDGVGNARGVYAGEALGGEDVPGLTLQNYGTISVTRGSITVSVSTAGALQGTFLPTMTTGALGIAAAVDSDDDAEQLAVINHAGGVIEATGPYVSAIYGRAGEVSIVNSGVIRNNSGGIAIAAHGAGDDEPGEFELTNTAGGIIQGDIVIVDANALRYWATQQGLTGLNLNNQAGVRDSEIENEGTIVGNIYLGSGKHVLTNEGEITGNILVDQNGIGTAIGKREFSLTNLGTLTGNITIQDVAGATNTVILAGPGFSGDIKATTGAGSNGLFLLGSGVLHNVSKFSTLQVGGQAPSVGGDDDDDGDDDQQSPSPTGPGTWTLASGTVQEFSAGAEVMAGSTLIVDSTLQANILVDAGATLGGAGTIQGNVTNSGTIQLSTAKLTVGGAVGLTAGSVLKTTLSGPGGASPNTPSTNAGQLVVGATGSADPTATVVPIASGAVHTGDWYLIGHNSNGGKIFDTLPGVQSSALVSWEIQDNGNNDLVIGATAHNATSIPGISSGGAGAVNTLLSYTGSDPKLLQLTSTLQSLPTDNQVRQAAENLRPDVSTARMQAARVVGDRVVSLVNSRLEATRVAGTGLSGVSTGDSLQGKAVWIEGFGFYGNQDADSNGSGGYSVSTGGLALGADTQVGSNEALRLGGAFSYAQSSVTGDGLDVGDTTSINTYLATAYGSYTAPNWYVDGSLSIAWQQFDTQRQVVVGSINDLATGSYGGWQLMASVEGGYPIHFGSTQVVPVASLTYNGLNQDSYTETSTSGAALSVGSSNTYSLRSGLGAKGLFTVSEGSLDTVIEVRAIWLHEFGDTSQNTSASFAAGGGTFTTPGSNFATTWRACAA